MTPGKCTVFHPLELIMQSLADKVRFVILLPMIPILCDPTISTGYEAVGAVLSKELAACTELSLLVTWKQRSEKK
jgi:hypothetical protein